MASVPRRPKAIDMTEESRLGVRASTVDDVIDVIQSMFIDGRIQDIDCTFWTDDHREIRIVSG